MACRCAMGVTRAMMELVSSVVLLMVSSPGGTDCLELAGAPVASGLRTAVTRGLDETSDERERRVGDLAPAAVDRERVPAVGNLVNLGHAGIVLLLLERGVRDRPRDGVVLFAGEDQQRAALRVLGVDLRLRPGVEV